MKLQIKTVIALLLLCASAYAQSLTVIELNNRPADELIPTLRPLLEPGDYLTGKDYELYLKAEPSTVKTVRDVVNRLDQGAAQLLISVTTRQALNREQSGASVNGSIGTDNARIQVGDGTGEDGLSVSAGERSTVQTNTTGPTVRASEGRPALIQQGLSVPVKVSERRRVGNRVIERERVEYHPVQTGFYVTARLNGDSVRLDIEQKNESPQRGGAINSMRLNTTVHGRLGEWLPAGSINTTQNRQSGAVAEGGAMTQQHLQTIMIKVDTAAHEMR